MKEDFLNLEKLSVSEVPPYDPLQAFVRENHIAIKGSGKGLLKNLKFAAKDVFKIKGSTVGNGHPLFLKISSPDEFTTPTIEKLLDNGADLVGKTVCDELCYSISGENWHYGSPLNPHDTRRFTGGSSSGSGAATAAGLVDFALGSDCLGSVRIPASYNGVYCLRPTYQRINSEGEAQYCDSMDVLAYLAKEKDVFLKVSKVLLGNDAAETVFKKLIIVDDAFEIVDIEVKQSLMSVINQYSEKKKIGIEHINLSDNSLEEWVKVFQTVQGYEVWQSYGGFINKYRPFVSEGPRSRLENASKITKESYINAVEKKNLITKLVESKIPKDGVLVLPTASSIAPLKTASFSEINKYRSQSSLLLTISPLTGIPQLNLPIAKLKQMPLGLSLMANKNTDLSLVKFSIDF